MRFAISRTYDSFVFGRLKTNLRFLALGLCAAASIFAGSKDAKAGVFDPAYANPVFNCTTGSGCCLQASMLIRDMFEGVGLYTGQQDLQQYYYMQTLFPKIETALKQFSNDAHNVVMMAISAKGAMMDGQALNLALLSLGKQTAESVVKETVSDQICRFGTMSRSLAASDDQSKVVQIGLATEMLQRDMMRSGLASAFEQSVGTKLGRTSDKASRFDEYKRLFCDPKDSNGGIGTWCTATTDKRYNADINSTRTLYNPMTLQLNFTPSGVASKTDDEETIFALASNLYAHDLPLNFSEGDFVSILKDNGQVSDARKQKLMDYRALTAKRTVAQNSFAALTAMKAEGTAGSGTYIKQMLEHMGLSAADQTSYLGANPSYYAQMDFLARKLYQTPNFYANLMESPQNVQRQQTAMEGIGLMQDRDIYDSLRRSEMVLSSLLEMYLVQEQDLATDRGTK